MQQIAPAALVYVWLLTEWVVFMWLKWFHCSLSVSIWPVFFSGISARLACQHPSYPSSHLHLIRVTKCASVFFSVVLTSKACSCLLRWPPPLFFLNLCSSEKRNTMVLCCHCYYLVLKNDCLHVQCTCSHLHCLTLSAFLFAENRKPALHCCI